ncbi:MAG: cytochrome c biogenesis protein ResB [Tannerellaceae bacterium]|nr:cytochrome c biogenesis protein ResB [Tannerellaceae bacterium]
MWKRPWGYAEGWSVCIGLFLTGLLLQWTLGKVEVDIYRYPVNIIVGAGYLFILATLSLFRKKMPVVQWLAGIPAAFTSLVSLLVVVILMGLTRQVSPEADLSSIGGVARLGFMQMTVSWPFLLLFLYFITVLGLVTLRRLIRFRKKDTGFICNHLGLFIALTAAVLGSGDLQRLRMTVQTETTEWRAMNRQNNLVELPLAIELKSFAIEEYPPKLLIVDNISGQPLPEKTPQNLVVEDIPLQGNILDWEITVTRFLPWAASYFQKDTVHFVEFHSVGATSAVYVEVYHHKNNIRKEGWVSSGNHFFPYASLKLTETESLVMPEREPKRFTSEVNVYTEKGGMKEATIDVNKPLSVDGWKIYQVSYDETKGKWSTVSVFELVRDPWMPLVYTGIILMLAGAFFLFITAPTKKEKR